MSESRRIPAFCTQCRSRCGCEAIVQNGQLVEVAPLPGHPSGSKLCPKGKAAPELVYHPDRLTQPMKRTSPKGVRPVTWQPISWDEALDVIAGHMDRIRSDHGAEQVAFAATTPSGTHFSDSISWAERFIRAYGSPNTIYSTEICNWHKDVASRLTYGSDIGTPDFAHTECVLLWGHNPTATWLARSTEVQQALRRGAKLIVVDPRPTLYARKADAWLNVMPGTDQALALGLANLVLEGDGYDAAFVREWTNAPLLVRSDSGAMLRQSDLEPDGSPTVMLAISPAGLLSYDASDGCWLDDPSAADLFAVHTVETLDGPVECLSALETFRRAAAQYPPAKVCKITGVNPEALHQAARLLSSSSSLAYYAWNGVGQSITATQTDRAISILYALLGHYGRQGGNVPGGAARFADIAGHDLLDDRQRAKALGLAKRPLGPGKSGWVTARDVYSAILDHHPYPVRMLFSFGGNLLSAQPDTERAIEALKQLEFHVHADFFMNASAEYADILLPAATSWEREGLRTGFDSSLDGLRRVQLRPPVIAPIGQSRSDTDIILDLSRRLGLSDLMFGCDADKGHDHVLAPAGLDVATLRASPAGIVLDTAVQLEPWRAAGFATPSKRIEIYSEQLHSIGQPPVPSLEAHRLPAAGDGAFPFRLGSAKVMAFCHSQHRNIPSLRRLLPDPIVEMSMEDATSRGIADNDWIRISTRTGAFVARARLSDGIAQGMVFAQHGWTSPDLAKVPALAASGLTANMNAAVPTDQSDPVSGSIPLRCSWCQVERL